MLVALPLAAYLLLIGTFRARGSDLRASVLHGSVLWGVSAVLITELLSLPGWLTPTGLAVAWLAVGAAAGAGLAVSALPGAARGPAVGARGPLPGSGRDPVVPPLDVGDLLVLAGAGLLVALVGVTALVSPPNTWDAMVYHMPRVVHWLQNRSVAFYPTHDPRQLYMAPGAEYLVLQFHALWGSDRLDNLVQWFAYAGSVVGVTLIARSLGAGPRGQALAAVVGATIPQGMLAASGAKNDHVLSFWLVALAYYLLDARRAPGPATSLGAGAALGLACLTKATAYLFAPPLLAALGLASPRSARRTLLTHLPLILLLALAVNAGHFVRNYSLSGSPLGQVAESPLGLFKYTNDAMPPSALVSNGIRNAALHLGTWDPRTNATIERWLLRAIRAAGADPNDPRTTWSFTAFRVPGASRHESLAGNPVHLLLIALGGVVLALRWRRADRRHLAYSAALVLGFLLFCAVLRWQPWHTRLHLPLFVLWSAAIGTLWGGARPAIAVRALGVLLLGLAVPFAVGNELRPLAVPGEASILRRDRSDLYFSDRRPLAEPYRAAASFVKGSGCRRVGLVLPADHFEYPLLVLLDAGPGRAEVRRVAVKNASARLRAAADFRPCAVICVECSREALVLGETPYRSAWSLGRTRVLVQSSLPLAETADEREPHLRVAPSGRRFRPGERLGVSVEVRNPPGGPAADLLVGILLPDARARFLVSEAGDLSAPGRLEALADLPRARAVPPGFTLPSPLSFEFTFPRAPEARGRYTVFAALVREGAFRENRANAEDILAVDIQDVDVGP